MYVLQTPKSRFIREFNSLLIYFEKDQYLAAIEVTSKGKIIALMVNPGNKYQPHPDGSELLDDLHPMRPEETIEWTRLKPAGNKLGISDCEYE